MPAADRILGTRRAGSAKMIVIQLGQHLCRQSNWEKLPQRHLAKQVAESFSRVIVMAETGGRRE